MVDKPGQQDRRQTNRRDGLLQQTALLIAAGLITRLLGFVYRILLARSIGAEGLGLYQMVFPILVLFLDMTTLSLPVTLSKTVAEAYAQHRPDWAATYLRVALRLTLGLGITFALSLYLAKDLIVGRLLADPRAEAPLLVSLPMLLVMAVGAVLQGYFRGIQRMVPLAAAQIVEQMARIAVGLSAAHAFIAAGIQYAAAGASLGTLTGEAVSTAFLAMLFWRIRSSFLPIRRSSLGASAALSQLLQISIPVTLSKLTDALAAAIQPMIITQALLAAQYAVREATAAYGRLAAMALPLVTFPTVITYALAMSLVPAVSQRAARQDATGMIAASTQTLRGVLLIGLPVTAVLYTLAEPLCQLVYGTMEAANLMQILSIGGLFLYLSTPSAAILQGAGYASLPFYVSVAQAILSLALTPVLVRSFSLGIEGAAWAQVIGMVVGGLANCIAVARRIGLRLGAKETARLFLPAGVLFLVLQLLAGCLQGFSLPIFVLVALFIGGLVYLASVLAFHSLSRSEWFALPWVGAWLKRLLS
ncbi:MAG: polysaccharide biosynthesis protein [Firmicutes bacterium]|nr:polysaccharide biosynthesis protein [Bacillota bacterium]